MQETKNQFYEFGEFRLDARRRILTRSGEKIALANRNFELLLVMIENDGRVLSHDELLEKVWAGMFVEQASLKKGISSLRHILGETPKSAEFIKTIPGRGYSFVAPVRAVETFAENPGAIFLRETEDEIFIEEIYDDGPPLIEAKKQAFFEKTKSRAPTIAVAAFLIFASIGAWLYLKKPDSPRFSVETAQIRRVTDEGSIGNAAVVSPDGNYIVYPAQEGGFVVLKNRQISTGSVISLTPPANVDFWAYAFSHDGNYVYYIINHESEPPKSGLYRVASLGGATEKLIERASGSLTFAPDGSRFAFSRSTDDKQHTEVVTAKPDGSDERRAFLIPNNRRLWSLNFSPDGGSFFCAFREQNDAKMSGFVSEIPVEGSAEQLSETIILPPQENIIVNSVWMPDKSSLLFSMREPNADICQIWQYFPATGERRRVTNDNNSYRALSLTRDGKTLVSAQMRYSTKIWIADAATLDFNPLAQEYDSGADVNWTHDGRLMLHTTENAREAVWLINADGSGRKALTGGDDGVWLFAGISQSGNYLSFMSRREGRQQIYRIGLDGKNLVRLTDEANDLFSQKLLSDGETVIYKRYERPEWYLFKKTPNGQIVRLTDTHTDFWDISPDERLLAYETRNTKTGLMQTVVKNLETGEIIRAFDFISGRGLKWTRDGTGLVRISANDNQLILQPLDGTPPKVLSGLRGERFFSFDFSFDGTKIAVVRGKEFSDAVVIRADDTR